ncbi:MAG: hypothetical protein HXX14_13475 [Bacteroidetes bacterium]|nr:hypothetical protein [Bacteroidota bacterium]
MKICFYISTLLYQHDCVVIPGMGGFIANYTPSHITPYKNNFAPPSKEIIFNSSLQHNDGLLANHIAYEEKITYAQAIIRIEHEVQALRLELETGKVVILENTGTLRLNKEKNILFTPNNKENYLDESFGLPTFSSPIIKRNEKKLKDLTKNHLKQPLKIIKIAAVLLPLLAIGLWVLFNWNLHYSVDKNLSSIIPSFHLIIPTQQSTEKHTSTIMSSHVVTNQPSVFDITPTSLRFAGVDPEIEMAIGIAEGFKIPFEHAESVTNSREFISTRKGSIELPHTYQLGMHTASRFLIIEGAFSHKENAEKRIKELHEMEIDATISGQNGNGLYLVCTSTCGNNLAAIDKLRELKAKGIQSAWILKK